MGAAKMKEIVPKEYYGKGTVYKFEDIDVKCPDKLDYLVHFYGDYMTPPPENERNRHNVTIIVGGGYNPCTAIFFPFAHYSIEGRCA